VSSDKIAAVERRLLLRALQPCREREQRLLIHLDAHGTTKAIEEVM